MIDGAYDRAQFLFYVVPQEPRRIPSLLILSKQPRAVEKEISETYGDAPRPTGEVSGEFQFEGTATGMKCLGKLRLPTHTGEFPGGRAAVPPTLLGLEIVWRAKRYFGKRILPIIATVIGLALFVGADRAAEYPPLCDIPKAADYLRYAAVFALAWAFNSFSSFVSSLKVTAEESGLGEKL